MHNYLITVDRDMFNELWGKRFDNDCKEIGDDERLHIFEMLMRKSDLVNEIESYIEHYIDWYICEGALDDYREHMRGEE